MRFIEQKNARIGWNADEDNVIKEFSVIEIEPGQVEPEHFQRLRHTHGNCFVAWAELSEFDMTMHIMRILFDYFFDSKESVKDALLQCGQIKEAKKIREMARILYYSGDLQEEFEERVYGEALK
jgi:hypothetical protein